MLLCAQRQSPPPVCLTSSPTSQLMITSATLSFSFCSSTHHQKQIGDLVCVMKATSGRAPLLRMLGDCRVLSCQRRWHLIKDDRKQNDELKKVEFAPTFERDQIVKSVESGPSAGSSTTGNEPMEPLSKGLMNTMEETPYRVSWYDFQTVSPAKRFTYWVYRRLRDLPPEWQEYYRSMVYQEISASRYVNQTWDCFMMVVDGYRKAKWVLRKYGVKVDESLIPRPYNNFWEETTHEERVWAHRRSHQMKELQALQRDDDEAVFGASMMNRNEVSYTSMKNLQTGMQGGTPLHAHDLPAPKESELRMSRQDEEMSSALMSSIEDDKLWNPVLRSRLHTQRQRAEAELYGFEDEDDDETAAEIQRK